MFHRAGLGKIFNLAQAYSEKSQDPGPEFAGVSYRCQTALSVCLILANWHSLGRGALDSCDDADSLVPVQAQRTQCWHRLRASVDYFEVSLHVAAWDRTLWAGVYRPVHHQTKKNFQPDLFDSDNGYYEYSAVTTSVNYERLHCGTSWRVEEPWRKPLQNSKASGPWVRCRRSKQCFHRTESFSPS